MAVDYFLIEGPRAVPQEFAAWEAARKEHADYFFNNCGPDPEPPPDFDERGQALARKAAALEETARAAFLLWLMRPKDGVAIPSIQQPAMWLDKCGVAWKNWEDANEAGGEPEPLYRANGVAGTLKGNGNG